MEISLLKALLNNISSFLLSSYNNCSDLNQKYYQKAEEVLKILKPILDAISDAEVTSEEELNKTFLELSQSVDELRELFQSWKPLSSKVNFVFQNESLLSKVQTSAQDCFQLLKPSGQDLPDGLSSSSLEYCLEKLKHMGYGQTSSVIKESMRDQLDGIGPSSETLVKIADLLSLKSNQEILIEAVALEKLKENAEQEEKAGEADFIYQMISMVTHMHDRLVLIKQSGTSSTVPIPPDFCCPLSLELMTDPVIVASGQTYERAFIKNWIDLGLTVCPKTRQTLAHTSMIPNFTLKALIANWCETNNVKLPDPKKILIQASPLLVHSESGSPNVFPHSRSNQQMLTELRSTSSAGVMEISLLKALLNNISSFLLSSYNNCSDLNQKYYQKAEEVLEMLKPILDAISDAEVTSEEELNKTFPELSQSVDELREVFQSWKPLSSKADFVFQNESLLSKIQTSAQDCFQLLKSSGQDLPDGSISSTLEYCLEKLKHMGYGQTSSVIKEAMRDQLDGIGPSSERLVKIADLLSLKSNQEILIEAVALEKLKENAEQAEKAGEADFIDQMISIVTHMHDRLVLIKQSETSSAVPIPPDFCCPLSLELMTDPVIVASGQTYERAFIKNWIDLGLTICPKTRQTLAHTCMIPNFTLKALIANWCETNNVKLPDPKKILIQASPLLVHSESGSPSVFPHSRSNQQMSTELVNKFSWIVIRHIVKPSLLQLIQSIAHGIGINNYQVHLLNATSQGNSSMITIAILPLGPTNYITNATALSIISQVAEHQISLPGTFGSYQLVNWEVEPSTNPSWWKQHPLSAVAAIGIVCAVAVSASGIWCIWRRRQETENAYKLVNEAVGEQELQPL